MTIPRSFRGAALSIAVAATPALAQSPASSSDNFAALANEFVFKTLSFSRCQ